MRLARLLAFILLAAPLAPSKVEARPTSGCEKKKTPAAPKKKKIKTPESTPTSKKDPVEEEAGPSPEPGAGDEIQRGERVEFDARLIQGQTARAGAVYLFERASTNLRSMVHHRASLREKIVASVFRPGEGESVSEAVEPGRPKKKSEPKGDSKSESKSDSKGDSEGRP